MPFSSPCRLLLRERAFFRGANDDDSHTLRVGMLLRGTLCGVLLMARPAAAEEAMTLESLAAALQTQLSSIQSIDVVYEVEHETNQAIIDAAGVAPSGKRRLWEWAEQGDCLLLEERDPEAPEHLKSAVTFDGRSGYRFFELTSIDGAPAPPEMEITKAVHPSYYHHMSLGFTYGKRGSLADASLPELMRLPGSALVGEEMISGWRCYKVDIARTAGPTGKTIKIVAYLDADHDILPARTILRYDTGEAQVDRFVTTMDINDYLRVRDGASGVDRWFAKLATSATDLVQTVTVRVKSVTINQPLKLERFRPQAPDETSVVDRRAEGEPKRYTLGGRAAQQAMIRRAADEAKLKLSEAPPAEKVVLDARPQRGFPVASSLLVVVAAVCFAVALYWFRRN